MLGLSEEIGRHAIRVGRRGRDDETFGRPRGEIDGGPPREFEFRRRHPGISRADDQVDWFDVVVRETEGEGADCLRAASHDDRVDAEHPGDTEEHRIDRTVGGRRGGDDDRLDAGDLRWDNGHDQA